MRQVSAASLKMALLGATLEQVEHFEYVRTMLLERKADLTFDKKGRFFVNLQNDAGREVKMDFMMYYLLVHARGENGCDKILNAKQDINQM
jgi:hypothetical protein